MANPPNHRGDECAGTFPEIGICLSPSSLAYRVLLTALLMLAILTGVAVTHYLDIPNDCQLVTVPH